MNDILIDSSERVLTITLNREEKKNSFTKFMYTAIADALDAAGQDSQVRCVLIQGQPTIFSAGNDIGDFLSEGLDDAEAPVIRFLQSIARFPKPVIASVCGPAVGVGTTMLFHCDLVYAGDNAAFSMPFVNLGLCPEAGSSLLAVQMMGYHRAAEALLLGDPFSAETALEIGLINRIVPPTEANALAQKQARKLASKPLPSIIETKRLMKSPMAAQVQKQMTEEALCFGKMLHQPAAKEALTAFIERRYPDFSNIN